MSKTIDIDGVTLTEREIEEVLAFWDAHCVGEVPDAIGEPVYGPRADRLGDEVLWYVGQEERLTPALVERLRDWLYPWTEVRRDEVRPGEVFRVLGMGLPGPSPDLLAGDGPEDGWCVQQGVRRVRRLERVVVRRRRKPAVTLRDVEPGQRVRRKGDDYTARRLGWDYLDGTEGSGVIREDSWRLEAWPGDTPVELVED